MNKLQFKLKDGTTRQFEPDELVPISVGSRKIGVVLLICGVLLVLIALLLFIVDGKFDLRTLLGIFFIIYGWAMFKSAPRKDENTIKDGFARYKGKVPAKNVANLRVMGSVITLIDDAGNKISPINEISVVS